VLADERQVIPGALVTVRADLAVVDDLLQLEIRIVIVADLVAAHLAAVRILRVDVADVLAKRSLADDVVERVPARAAVARRERERVRLAGERAGLPVVERHAIAGLHREHVAVAVTHRRTGLDGPPFAARRVAHARAAGAEPTVVGTRD